MTRHREFDDCTCCVCARPATGFGYSSNAKKPEDIAFVCDDPQCLQIAKDSYGMKQEEFGRLDTLATMDAGDAAEDYCDRIGKSDLRDLTEGEWVVLLQTIVGAYRGALKGRLRNEAPF